MRIIWHGHACFEVQGEDVKVVLDPHDGRSLGIRAPRCQPDLVLVSHDHFDHNAVRAVKGDFSTVTDPGAKEVKGVRLNGIEAAHDDVGGTKRGRVVMFRCEVEGVSFLHCGDLGQPLTPEQLRSIGKVDVAFVPVGGVFTLDGKQARKAVQDIGPKVAVPMHYRYGGLTLSIQTVDPFLEGLPKTKIQRLGSSVEFTRDELPSETEYWVFSL